MYYFSKHEAEIFWNLSLIIRGGVAIIQIIQRLFPCCGWYAEANSSTCGAEREFNAHHNKGINLGKDFFGDSAGFGYRFSYSIWENFRDDSLLAYPPQVQ